MKAEVPGGRPLEYDIAFAGSRIRIVSAERARRFFADYLAPEPGEAAFAVAEPTAEELAREGLSDTWENRKLALHGRICRGLLEHDTLLFHGSALMLDGRAYLFTAPSGTGKSTHAALWRQLLGGRVTMLNDDKPWLHIGETIMVYGSPWAGKHNLNTNACAPLAALCFLEQARENRIERLTPKQAVVRLLSQLYYWENAREAQTILKLMDPLLRRVPVWLLRCDISLDAARLSCATLTGRPLEEPA